MLAETIAYRNVYIICGYTDMRKSSNGLVAILTQQYQIKPDAESLFLFCGKRADRCKGLLWMGNGFLLLYRRFESGRLEWPRSKQEAAELTEEQFHLLMHGFDPVKIRIQDVNPRKLV